MRIVLQDATFSTFGIKNSDPIVSRIADNYGGIGNRIGVVRKFINALGADDRNDIWPKIEYLYMPVLAVPEDGVKALYDIIKEVNYPGSNYTIESNRGVGPTSLGSGIGSFTLPTDLVDDDSLSGFCVITQSSRQTLTGNSGRCLSFCGLEATWKHDYIEFGGSDSANRVYISNGFSQPQAVVFSKKVNGERTVLGRDSETAITTAKSTNAICINGTYSFADTAIFALCKNLTPDDAAVVVAAINNFINDFGIACANL